MFVSYTIVNPLTIIRTTRRLPRKGEVLARVGDPVEPAHIVAQANEPPDFRIIDVARELDVPVKKTATCVRVKDGDNVNEGDVLATRGGLGARAVRAPISGVIVGKGRGRLWLEAPPTLIRLNALVPGTVVTVLPGEGVVIETVGAHIQAAWGNGREAFGVMRAVVRAPKNPMRPKHIDASAQGAILVGGSKIDEETLEHAIEMQVRGIIVGSIPPSLMKRLETVTFPVIATEGIGDMPMCQAIFDLLRSIDGREAAVSGQWQAGSSFKRPYIVTPMPTQAGNPVDPESPPAVGNRVRVLRGPYASASGIIAEMPTGAVPLENGARMPGVYVDVGKERAFVPFANLERLL
ncbi:MAG TPA: hypothetical protein PKH77_06895 [Anaerolineae bacterium]|nr:hypothetical protein [Anaerolineae bacterium]